MGLATHNPGGQVRFGVTATAASAVLYSAVVLLGVKAASTSALDRGGDRDSSVVLIRPHDSAAPGPRLKLPQASPGPARRHLKAAGPAPAPRVGVGTRSSAPRPASAPAEPSAPASPRGTESKSKPAGQSEPAQPAPTTPILEVTPPPLPEPPLPVPTISVPEVPALPVPLPATPTLPQLPGVSDLPG